jgi:hypothetical protein
MRRLIVISALAIFATLLPAQSRRNIPSAPAPAVLSSAHKVFLANGGGNDLAFDAFYSGMKKWGQYQIVDSIDDAELVVQVTSVIQPVDWDTWSNVSKSDVAFTKSDTTYRAVPSLIQLRLSVIDARRNLPVWATVDFVKPAMLEGNIQKETILSADRLVDSLKSRVTTATASK